MKYGPNDTSFRVAPLVPFFVCSVLFGHFGKTKTCACVKKVFLCKLGVLYIDVLGGLFFAAVFFWFSGSGNAEKKGRCKMKMKNNSITFNLILPVVFFSSLIFLTPKFLDSVAVLFVCSSEADNYNCISSVKVILVHSSESLVCLSVCLSVCITQLITTTKKFTKNNPINRQRKNKV